MNDDIVNDLKQFITATVSQQLANQTEEILEDVKKLEIKIDNGNSKLNHKVDDISISIGEALDTANDVVDKQIKDHENRISILEQKLA